MDQQQILIFALVALAAGALFYVFAVPANTRADKRQKAFAANRTVARGQASAQREALLRRSHISQSLKEVEKREANLRNPPLSTRIARAGLDWPVRKFYIASAVAGLAIMALVFMFTFSLPIAFLAGFAGAFGLPRWALTYVTKRRQKRFLKEFPAAIDIIVRGVKSGLPLGDCIRIVASEAQEPIKQEFRTIMETQAIGMPLGEAVDRLYERVGVPEANFFAIVISIQSQSGGNLSEALGNLARVLRERAKMAAKIQAMSMEAKASGVIIGSLPIAVAGLVYLMSPDYLRPLWTTNLGLVLLGGGAFWMMCGIITMRQMINFDF